MELVVYAVLLGVGSVARFTVHLYLERPHSTLFAFSVDRPLL